MPSYVIVGASRGLGYEWLRQLSSDPSNTVIGLVRTIDATSSRLLADNITNVHLIQADMTSVDSLNAAASSTSTLTNGALDYLIINGVYSRSETMPLTPTSFISRESLLREDLIAAMDVNVLGAMYSINAFLPLIRAGAIKKIIAISTGLADTESVPKTGVAWAVVYSISKAALNMVVAKYAAELKGEGIVLLALSPGVVNTKEGQPTPEEIKQSQEMFKQFKAWSPDFNGPLAPAESVKLQRNVIEQITIEDSGAFLSHWGNKQWL